MAVTATIPINSIPIGMVSAGVPVLVHPEWMRFFRDLQVRGGGVSGVIPATGGGTGFSSYTVGDIVYADTASSLARLNATATGNALISAGIGTPPAWGKIGLTTHVVGVLPVGSGGTGIASGNSGGIPYYSSAGTIASSAALAANRIVLGGGAGATPATLGTLGTTTTVLHGNAVGAPTFGAVSLAADVSGVLGPANGGTGVANNAASTITISGSFASTFTLTGVTSVTFPTSGTLATTTQLPVGANPSASVGLSAVNGVASTFMRSDGAPALSQAITPTWTGNHTFSPASGSTLFTAGHIGVGDTPPAWSGAGPAVHVGANGGFLQGDALVARLGLNCYYNGANWVRRALGETTLYVQNTGNHVWLSNASGAAGGTFTHTETCRLDADGQLALKVVGRGLSVAEGANAKQGTATLVAGASTVANTSITANSRIQLTSQADGGTPGWLRVSARVVGTSFTITSSSGTDTSTVAYFITEPS